MQPTLDRDVAEAIYRLVGEYETEDFEEEVREPWVVCIPLPNFAELIRIFPKVGEAKGWDYYRNDYGLPSICGFASVLTGFYMKPPPQTKA